MYVRGITGGLRGQSAPLLPQRRDHPPGDGGVPPARPVGVELHPAALDRDLHRRALPERLRPLSRGTLPPQHHHRLLLHAYAELLSGRRRHQGADGDFIVRAFGLRG